MLTHWEMDVVESSDIKDALSKCAEKKFDLLILDYNLNDDEIGWDVAPAVCRNPKRYGVPRILQEKLPSIT